MSLINNISKVDSFSDLSQKPFWNKVTSIFSTNNSIDAQSQDLNAPTDLTPDEQNVLHIVIDNYPPKIEGRQVAKEIFVGLAPLFLMGAISLVVSILSGRQMYYYKQKKNAESKKRLCNHFQSLINKPTMEIVTMFRDEGMYGQDEAVNRAAVFIKDHATSMVEKLNPTFDPVSSRNFIKRKTLLFLGPSGSGKTEMFKIISTILKVPCVCKNAASAKPVYSRDDNIAIKKAMKELSAQENGEYGILGIDEAGKGIANENIDPLSLLTTFEEIHPLSAVGEDVLEDIVRIVYQQLGWKLPIRYCYASTIFIESFSMPGKKGHNLERMICTRNTAVKQNGKDWVAYATSSDVAQYGFGDDFANRFTLYKLPALAPEDFVAILANPSKNFQAIKGSLEKELNIKLILTPFVLQKISEEKVFSTRGARSIEDAFNAICLEVRRNETLSMRTDKEECQIKYELPPETVQTVINRWKETDKK